MQKHRKIAVLHLVMLYGYSAIWFLFRIGSKIFIPFNSTIKEQSRNRKYGSRRLTEMSESRNEFEKCVLFYCSSAGEYEQAKPLINRLKADHYIYIFFFSVSGYKYAKKLEEEVDFGMTPIDTIWNWNRVLKSLNPSLSIIVRHEFWPSFILTNYQYSKTIAIDVFIRDETSKLALWFKNFLFSYLDQLYVVSDKEILLLSDNNLEKTSVMSNTKFDRSLERKEERSAIRIEIAQKIDQFLGRGKRLIVGSAWKEDVRIALDAYPLIFANKDQNWKLIIVPHDISNPMIDWIVSECKKRELSYWKYSHDSSTNDASVLIVDELGCLFELYGCADLAIIGGGFRQGVHNIIEAAVYHLPIVSGSITHTDREAMIYREADLLATVDNKEELVDWWNANQEHNELKRKAIKNRILQDSGSTEKLIDSIKNNK